MTVELQPRMRRVECFPVKQADGQAHFALRDPEGFSPSIVIPYEAAVLASLMDGNRTLADIQETFRQHFNEQVPLEHLEQLVHDLDERLYLDSDRFRARWKYELEAFLNSKTRPAAHAGLAYPNDPEQLRATLGELFVAEQGPGMPRDDDAPAQSGLLGVLSPHIDFRRGGPTFAWAYKRLVEESDADLFVIFGTAHNPMRNLFSVTRKHFETPLGLVETDRKFAARLSAHLRAAAGPDYDLAADELAHRQEHSIEFQVVFLQYLLGQRRPFRILPVLVGSFHEMIAAGQLPSESAEVAAFVAALQKAAAEYQGRICYISGSDLAHIGRRFGDQALVDQARLQDQAADDRQLLDAAAGADAAQFFRHVADQGDRNRICGLSPTYTMLEVMRPARGELLKYDQAVELDGTSCVSFASMAFYGE